MEDEHVKLKFMQLVAGLQSSAWMLMGKIANPLTGKIEKDLNAVKETIDTLSVLKEKTKGNLSREEEDFLNNSLQQLQINYVEEAKEGKEEKTETKEKEGVKKEETEKKGVKK